MSGELVSPPRLKNPSIPKAISDIVMRAMAPDVTARYQRAADLLEDLLAARAPARRAAGRPPSAATGRRRAGDDAQGDPVAAAGARSARRPVLLALPQAAARAHRSLPVLRRNAVDPRVRGPASRRKHLDVRAEPEPRSEPADPMLNFRFQAQTSASTSARPLQGVSDGFTGTGKIWMNGTIRRLGRRQHPRRLARHPLRSGVFEGARCYETPRGSACFRLDAHMRRLYDSAKIYRMDRPRPRGADRGGARDDPRQRVQGLLHPARSSIAATTSSASIRCPARSNRDPDWEWGAYLGDERSSRAWTSASAPGRGRAEHVPDAGEDLANYANSQLIKMEAIADGYSEGIALDTQRPPQRRQRPEPVPGPRRRASTRRRWRRRSCRASRATRSSRWRRISASRCARSMLPREMLYIADEVFFVGTAAEITPIRSVDKITDRHGRRGPVTEALQPRVLRLHQRRGARPARLADFVYPGEPLRPAAGGASSATARESAGIDGA